MHVHYVPTGVQKGDGEPEATPLSSLPFFFQTFHVHAQASANRY